MSESSAEFMVGFTLGGVVMFIMLVPAILSMKVIQWLFM